MSADITTGSCRTAQIVRRLTGAAAFDSFGTGIGAAAAILYFVTLRGYLTGAVALAMSTGAVLGILSPVPFGRLADRYGLTRVYVALLIVRGALSMAYPFAVNFSMFAALTWALLALETTTPPLQQAVVSRVCEAKAKVRLMARVMAARNAGLGAGTLAAGLALATRSTALVAAMLALNGFTFLVMAAAVYSLRDDVRRSHRAEARDSPTGPEPADVRPVTADDRHRPVLRNPAFLGLCATNGLLLLHDSVLFVLLPLWTVTRLGLSPVILAAMLATNTALSVVLQSAFSRINLAAVPRRVLVASIAFLCMACLFGAVAERVHRFALVVVVCLAIVVLLTLGENLHSVLAWQVSFALAPTPRHGEYLSAFNTGFAVQRVVGPVTMTAVVLALHGAGWLILAAAFVGAAAGFWYLARRQGFRAEPTAVEMAESAR